MGVRSGGKETCAERSTSLTMDAGGSVVSEMRYSAWGEVRYEAGSTPTEYTYTGQYSNVTEFGLLFYNARWYDPSISHFLQADTVIPGAGQSQVWDRYAYVNNSPVRYTDPSGHYRVEGQGSIRGCSNLRYCGFRTNSGERQGNKAARPTGPGLTLPPVSNPPFNVMVPAPIPISIFGDDLSFYSYPFAVKMTTQPSITIQNGSPLTIGPDRLIIAGQNGNVTNRFTVTSSIRNSFGWASFDQVNDTVKNSLGVSIPSQLTPQEISVTITTSPTMNLPTSGSSDLSTNMTIPITISARYNPHSLAMVGIGALSGAALLLAWEVIPAAGGALSLGRVFQ